MKISHFPDFLPGETMFSVCSRYLDRMQFPSHSTVSQHFFGRPQMSGVKDLPSSLDHLLQALPPHHTYTVDSIIDQHTHFPLYAYFLPFERAFTLRQRLKTNGSTVFNINIAGARRSGIPRLQWLRYCPECINYDRLTYGEGYWHRLHQIPWVLVCPTHEVMLEDSSVNLVHGNKIAQFCSAERSVMNLSCRKAPAHLRTALQRLASNTQWLLEEPTRVEREYLRRQYIGLLVNRGFATTTGRMRFARLKEAMLDYYPAHLLEDLGCDIKQRGSWLEDWRRIQHPLHHLLFIQLLCETLQEFFSHPQYLPDPFGSGPWPCLNPLCPHYKAPAIASYALKENHLNQPIGTFTCDCGFSYARTGPDADDDAIFRVGGVSQYGHLWDHHLTTYWLDQNISTRQIARLMHTMVATVRRQAARLSLPFAPDIPRRGERPKIYQDFIEEQRDLYHSLLVEEFRAHPDMKVREVPSKIYHWFQRHDPEGFKKYFPNVGLSSKQERLTRGRAQLRHNSNASVDSDWANVIRQTAEEIRSSSGFPVRVTRKLLIAKLGHPVLFNRSNVAFDSLPLTLRALDESIETSTAFIWRKLRWSVQSCLDEQVFPSYRAFQRRARIKYESLPPLNIKQLTQIAYSSLRAGNLLDDQLPEIYLAHSGEEIVGKEGIEAIASGSLASICLGKQLILPDKVARQKRLIYDPLSILLLTVAAVVNGAESVYCVANWGYQNEDLLYWFGFPKGRFPAYDTLQRSYAILDVDSFERIVGAWLHKNFPLQENEAIEVKAHTGSTYVPGLSLLRPYQDIASEVVAKLR